MWNISIVHFFVALLVATITVVMPGGGMFMPIPWIVIVAIACRCQSELWRRIAVLLTYVSVTAGVVVAATLAPGKTSELILDRVIVLPSTELTLAEMDREKNYDSTQWMPRYVHIYALGKVAEMPIRFPAQVITLREFVGAIESQTGLHHHFSHCGNCSTILYGGSCTFGMTIN
jgi:hypothetical protein